MKKIGKFIIIILSVIILFILAVVVWMNVSSYLQRKQAKRDLVEGTIICDTIQTIAEQPKIVFLKFTDDEVTPLIFELKRNNRIIADTVVQNNFEYISDDREYRTAKIPFSEFLKTDTVVITLPNHSKYNASGFHHYPYLHYGMFGYVGSYDCRLSEYFTINGVENTNIIEKKGN